MITLVTPGEAQSMAGGEDEARGLRVRQLGQSLDFGVGWVSAGPAFVVHDLRV